MKTIKSDHKRNHLDTTDNLTYASITKLISDLDFPISIIANILNISPRTLSRRKAKGVFNTSESTKLRSFSKLIKRANGIFGIHGSTTRWFKSPLRTLHNKSPLEHLISNKELDSINCLLGRIEHGVFS